MRTVQTLPLVAAILLGACGGGDADTNADGALTTEEVAVEAQGMVQPRPGQYRTTLELLEFDAPGVPDDAKAKMQEAFASGLSEGNTFCMTEAQAAQNGPRQMVENLAEAKCDMKAFNVSGNSVVAEMQCPGQGGKSNTIKMEGDMTADSSVMTMDMTQDMPGTGALTMKMRVNSERIGECSA